MAVCNTPPHYRVYRKNRRFPLFPRKNFHLIYNMGVAGLQYRPCRARGETRQAPRRPRLPAHREHFAARAGEAVSPGKRPRHPPRGAKCSRWAGNLLRTVRQNAARPGGIGAFSHKRDAKAAENRETDGKPRRTGRGGGGSGETKPAEKFLKMCKMVLNKNKSENLILF